MKTQLFTILLVTFCLVIAKSQKYEANTNAKNLVLETGGLFIEGHTGKSIIIEEYKPEKSENKESKFDEFYGQNPTTNITGWAQSDRDYPNRNWNSNEDRKKGMSVINPSGIKDNTGFDLAVNDNGTDIVIKAVSKNCCKNIKVKVPNTMNIKGNVNGAWNQKSIIISNINGEIDLSTQYNKILLDNLTGPILAKSTFGNIEGSLSQPLKEPISILSAHGLIDIELQEAPKINVELNTPWGTTYISDKLNVELTDKSEQQGFKQAKIKGKINGGGPLISLSSNFGNIYLRTK